MVSLVGGWGPETVILFSSPLFPSFIPPSLPPSLPSLPPSLPPPPGLQVLCIYKLMLVTYEEFEEVMRSCHAIFDTWDEEYDRFSAQLREMSKKKREEPLKFAWRANPAHKRLEERIKRMKE